MQQVIGEPTADYDWHKVGVTFDFLPKLLERPAGFRVQISVNTEALEEPGRQDSGWDSTGRPSPRCADRDVSRRGTCRCRRRLRPDH